MLDLCFCSRGNRSTHSGKDGPQTPHLTSQRAHIALRSWRYVMATAWEDSLMIDAPLMNSISTADFICGLAMSLQNCRDMTSVCSLSHRPLIPFARMLENFSCNSSCTSGCTGTSKSYGSESGPSKPFYALGIALRALISIQKSKRKLLVQGWQDDFSLFISSARTLQLWICSFSTFWCNYLLI